MLDDIQSLEEKRRFVERLLAEVEAFLAGQVGPIETARSLISFRLKDRDLDKALATFELVESETDTLPLGEVRKLWNVEALKRKDLEIADAEFWCREMVSEACRELVKILTPILKELSDQRSRE